MSLEKQIEEARKEIASDGYDMSAGELINLYRNDELIIHPEYQRLFRWDETKKTRFIESLLLGIPVPPIFVFQTAEGIWELIDGLQRLSTILEFAGVLKPREGEAFSLLPVALEGTNFLPALDGRVWEEGAAGMKGIGFGAQLLIKRARMRVEILKKESDPSARYELFQRLNTGGVELTQQEVRNCTAIMINPEFYRWLIQLSQYEPFLITTSQTDEALKKQAGVELVLRFFAFRKIQYQSGLDVHEYLDKALIDMARVATFPFAIEGTLFENTFQLLLDAMGSDAFKRWDGIHFSGKFLMSLFEVIATGVSENIVAITQLGRPAALQFIETRSKELWQNNTFQQNSGAGVRGTTRLSKLLPMAAEYFRP